MAASRRLGTLLGLVAAVFALACLWLAFDNPEIDGTSKGDGYSCLAPWDTVLNGADNAPGGEPPPDTEVIASRCREAGRGRFDLAVASGSASVVVATLALAVTMRRRRTSAGSPG